MQFTSVLTLAAVAAVASAQNSTSTAEVHHDSTTVITITSCEEDKCHEVPVTTGLTVVTKTIEGTVTEYTTYCPISTSTAEVHKESTTVVTITSCEEDKCHEVPVTTGLTVVTKTVEGTLTEYTTYCPISSEEKASTATKQVTSTVHQANTTSHQISTFEGAAARAIPAVAAVAAGVALLF